MKSTSSIWMILMLMTLISMTRNCLIRQHQFVELCVSFVPPIFLKCILSLQFYVALIKYKLTFYLDIFHYVCVIKNILNFGLALKVTKFGPIMYLLFWGYMVVRSAMYSVL